MEHDKKKYIHDVACLTFFCFVRGYECLPFTNVI
jgi:hypothetical protein